MATVDFQNTKPMITVITDASWCPSTKCAGWAAWAVCDKVRYQNSGAVRPRVMSSGEAEFIALISGLELALSAYHPPQGTRILLQSDSLDALRIFDIRRKNPNMALPSGNEWWLRRAVERMLDFMHNTGRGMLYETRHVKGHSSSKEGSRFYVNNWADEEAKKQMRSMRARISGKK